MNQLYNDGLISPEWYLDKDGNQKQADFVSGKAGVFGFYCHKILLYFKHYCKIALRKGCSA